MRSTHQQGQQHRRKHRSQRSYRATRTSVKQIAEERMEHLLNQARLTLTSHPDLSKRYVQLAWKISTRNKVRLSPLQKQYLCRNCGTLLVPGLNARVRLRPGRIRVLTCLSCKNLRRYPFYQRNTKRSRPMPQSATRVEKLLAEQP